LLFGQVHAPPTWGASPRWEGSSPIGCLSLPPIASYARLVYEMRSSMAGRTPGVAELVRE
jgi:hypothetical protein